MEFTFRCYSKTTTFIEVQSKQSALAVVRFCPPVSPQGIEAFEVRMTEAVANGFEVGKEYRFSIMSEAQAR